MPISLHFTHRQNLLLIRQIYDRAIKHSERPYGFADGILALIGFDLANESAIKAVFSAVSGRLMPPTDKGGRFLTFHGIIEKTNEELAKQKLAAIPGITSIEFVHARRNESQHNAVTPHDSVLKAAQVYTKDFLMEIVNNVFGVDFFSIDLIDLIRHEYARNLLLSAKNRIESGDYTNSGFDSIAAFDKLKNLLYVESPISITRPAAPTSSSEEMKRIISLEVSIQKLTLSTLYLASGFDFPSEKKYRAISDGMHLAWFGEEEYKKALSRAKLNMDEAGFLLDYVADAGFRIENFLDTFQNPFGLKTPD